MTNGPPATHRRQEGLFLFIVSGTLFAGYRGSCAVAPTHCRQRAFWKPGQGCCRVCLRELSLGCRIGRFVAVTVWLTSAHKRDQARCLSWVKRYRVDTVASPTMSRCAPIADVLLHSSETTQCAMLASDHSDQLRDFTTMILIGERADTARANGDGLRQ